MARKKPADRAKPKTRTKAQSELAEPLRRRLADIVAATDRFCDEHLDAEYRDLCRDLTATLVGEGFPVTSGKAEGWAAGVAYTVGWVNFIGDPSQPHHMRAEDMAPALGVSPATLMNRARDIREGLGLRRMDPRWSTKAMRERNPLLRMAEYLAGDEGNE